MPKPTGEIGHRKAISKLFKLNGISTAFIIPLDFAKKFDMLPPAYVTFVETDEGVLIKKIDL